MGIGLSSSIDAYRELCQKETSIPLFCQAWWLDAVAGETWGVVLAHGGTQVIGALPYVWKKKFGCTLISQPKLTQALGPWVRSTQKAYPNALAYEKDVLSALAHGLPKYSSYAQCWHPERQNWLPFYWLGFNQTTRYTYRLDLRLGVDGLWAGFQKDIRGNVRKAQDRFGVSVREGESISELIPVLRKTFSRQNKAFPFSSAFLQKVDNAAAERGSRLVLLAEDGDGRVHAGTFVVWNGDTAYQLLNGYDPDLRESGAGALCVWTAIKRCSEYVGVYDFEGSMLEPVERFFRAFGARQVPYFRVSRTPSRLLKLAIDVRTMAKGIA